MPAYAARADIYQALGQPNKAIEDRAAAESVRTKQEEARRTAQKPPRVKIKISGSFPRIPSFLKMDFKFDNVIEVKDDEITYQSPGLSPYKISSGDKFEENFPGVCIGKQTSDQGLRAVTAAVDKYLVHVQLQSRLEFRSGGCLGKHNYYKENFLINFSEGGCKFTYTQVRDLTGVGEFDSTVADQSCVAETLR